jgi:hypothetical protein
MNYISCAVAVSVIAVILKGDLSLSRAILFLLPTTPEGAPLRKNKQAV